MDEPDVEVVDVIAALPVEPEKEPPAKLTPRHIILLVEMLFLALSVMYVEMCLVPALPVISQLWAKDAEWIPYVLSAYNIVGALATPIAGTLADRYGPKWVAMGALSGYACGQVICALAGNMWVLIAGRAVQGLGMTCFQLNFTVIKKTFPPKVVPIAIGAVSTMFSIGVSIGLVGGAAFMDKVGSDHWQTVFWTTFGPICILIVALGITLPSMPGRGGRTLDIPGVIVIAIGLVCFLIGFTLSEINGWGHPATIVLVSVGSVLLVGFVIMEYYIKDPLIPVRIVVQRNQLAAAGLAFVAGMCMFGLFQIFPYLIRSSQNNILPAGKKTMLQVALVLLPYGLVQLPMTPVGIAIGKIFSFSNLSSIATGGMAIGIGLLIKFHYTKTQTILVLVLLGFTMGWQMISLMNIVAQFGAKETFGALTGANTLCRIVAGAIGPVVINVIVNHNPIVHKIPVVAAFNSTSSSSSVAVHYITLTEPSDQGFKNGFWLVLALAICAHLISWAVEGKLQFCQTIRARRAKKLEEATSEPDGTPAEQSQTITPVTPAATN